MSDVYQKVKPLVVFIWDGARTDPNAILSPNSPGAWGTGFEAPLRAPSKRIWRT